MKSKKAATLSIETIVIVIIALLVLLVILFIFSSGMRQIFTDLMNKIGEVFGLWESTGVTE